MKTMRLIHRIIAGILLLIGREVDSFNYYKKHVK